MKKFIPLILMTLCAGASTAQRNMTLYQMHEIVQSNSLNPAVPGDCRWTIGLPLLGNVSMAANMPIAYNDLGAGSNRPLHGDEILAKIPNTVAFSADASVNLITIGYRTNSSYFQFTLNERFEFAGSVSKELIELALKGNAQVVGKTIDAQPKTAAAYYREYGFGATHDFGSGLWAGARLKLFFGRLGFAGADNKISLYTDPSTYDLTAMSDLLIRTSIPGRTVEYNPDGSIKKMKAEVNAGDFIFNPSNLGGGLDLGIIKSTENGWKFSASILNIGMIKWSKNLSSLKQNSTIRYSGPRPAINTWNDLLDSIKSVVRLHEHNESGYTQWLSPVLMLGASYPVAEHIRAGLTGMSEYRAKSVFWALTATAFTEEYEHFTAGLSYTLTPSSYLNLGLGFGLRFGAFNLHLLTDNVIALFVPFSQRYATVQCGIHFRFGCHGAGNSSSDRRVYPCAAYAKTAGAVGN
ncbi:MAG: DUF5723 family protein [Prevotellaceae bacterium]|jgi:hypothetical protein|nr:DUF5723 family protein [Prevotellaceae bacterium]